MEARIDLLISDITVYYYKSISRILLENHKKIFAFLIAIYCNVNFKDTKQKELWDFFIY